MDKRLVLAKSAPEEQFEWMIGQSQPQMERHMQHYHHAEVQVFPSWVISIFLIWNRKAFS